MQFLIDTHVLLWALSDSNKLKKSIVELIEDENNVILVSIATLWELQIKESINKIKLPANFFGSLNQSGYEILPITIQHLETLKILPMYHRDPFERMLIAQANTDKLKLITQDSDICKYEVQVVITYIPRPSKQFV